MSTNKQLTKVVRNIDRKKYPFIAMDFNRVWWAFSNKPICNYKTSRWELPSDGNVINITRFFNGMLPEMAGIEWDDYYWHSYENYERSLHLSKIQPRRLQFDIGCNSEFRFMTMAEDSSWNGYTELPKWFPKENRWVKVSGEEFRISDMNSSLPSTEDMLSSQSLHIYSVENETWFRCIAVGNRFISIPSRKLRNNKILLEIIKYLQYCVSSANSKLFDMRNKFEATPCKLVGESMVDAFDHYEEPEFVEREKPEIPTMKW